MRWPTLSMRAWKTLLFSVALFVATLLATEVCYAPRTLAPGAAGTLGITYHELHEWGRSRYVIDEIAPGSPILAAGARIGDIWMPDRAYDAQRRLEANEPVALTLTGPSGTKHVTVMTMPDAAPNYPGLFVAGWVFSAVLLILGLAIGLRLPNGVANRALALFVVMFAGFTLFRGFRILPAGTVFLIHHLSWGPAMVTIGILIVTLVFNFPDDQPRNTALKRGFLRYVVPALAVLLGIGVVAILARSIGYYVPLYDDLQLLVGALFGLVCVAVMWTNWRDAVGELRQRHLWLLIALTPICVVPFVLNLAREFRVDPYSVPTIAGAIRANESLAMLLIMYAVARRRVVSIGFAVNRVVVYGAASIGMLVSFGILEWVAHRLLEFSGREKSALVDAGIALLIFLAFHRLRGWGETWIERLFFHAWHARDEALRRFVREAAFIRSPEALLAAFTASLDRFTGRAAHALYRRTRTGCYERVTATIAEAPDRIAEDDPLAVTMRASQSVTHCSDTWTSLPGDIALPSIHHGELDGFVLLGPKPDGETYRPDEIELLGFAARQVGLDFRALRMEQLERAVADLSDRNRELESRMTEFRQLMRDNLRATPD